jgi:hypothetical protein
MEFLAAAAAAGRDNNNDRSLHVGDVVAGGGNECAVGGEEAVKIGEFDWIADYSQLQQHIDRCWDGIDAVSIDNNSASRSGSKADQRVLVIGCGTSPLSAALVGRSGARCDAHGVEIVTNIMLLL